MTQQTIEGFRLSPQQRRLWRLLETGGSWRSRSVFRLTGRVDVEALRSALAQVVRRHEILRTRFPRLPGMALPVQVIEDDAASPEWSVVESEVTFEEALGELLAEDSSRPFTIEEPPLCLRLVVLPEDSLLLLSLSPLCADGSSLIQVGREIAHLYTAKVEGEMDAEALDSSDEILQYADFSQWQNEGLEGEDGEEGREFWRRHRPVLDKPDLLFGNWGSPPAAFAPECYAIPLDPACGARVAALSRRFEISEDAVLLACWHALLGRFTDGATVIVNAALDGRDYEELQGAVGVFVRYAPVIARVAETRRLDDLMRQNQERLEEATLWQEYFTWESSSAGTEEPSELPYGFELELESAPVELGELTVSTAARESYTERFALRWVGRRCGDRLNAALHYDASRLHRGDVGQLASSFAALLDSALQDPGRELGELELLGEDQHRLIVEEWNRTAAPFPADLLIHQLFERQAARRPRAPALLFGEQSLSYGALNAQADQLAAGLLAHGVGPEVRIVLFFERCPEMVVALLAVLKAGSTYVALHPGHPFRRLRSVMDDVCPRVVISDRRWLSRLPHSSAAVIDLAAFQAPEDRPLQAPQSAGPDQLAYIVYTSGSTGRPKGVAISHRGVVSYLTFLVREYGLDETDVVLQVPDLIYDASVRDILGPLSCGARVVLVAEEQSRDPAALLAAVRKHHVSCLLSLVPTMLRALLAAAGSEHYDSVRILLVSGEVLRLEDCASAWRTFSGGARVVNQYGPTESTMTASFYPVLPELGDGELAIGRPIANIELCVLDRRLRPQPPGVPGQLHIGGVGLTRGYLGQPGRTAESFVPHPWTARPGQRLYQTGDLARHGGDGSLYFLGRLDQQLKLRGIRVEPGEIEARLRAHPAVAATTVVGREEQPGGLQLVAYVVAQDGAQPIEAGELRDFLRGVLPEALVPATFVELDALPLTVSGKVDRGALPAPPRGERQGSRRELWSTPTEEIVAGILAEVLGRREVGRDDDFFALGGHSLLGTRVILRLDQAFGVEVPLQRLFEAPTARQLAEIVEQTLQASGDDARETPPPLAPVPRGTVLPLSFAQQRLWFLHQLDPHDTSYNVRSAVHMTGALELSVLGRALDEIVRRHGSLRTTFGLEGDEPAQRVAPASSIPLPVIDLSRLPERRRTAESERLLETESRRPFDLSRGPLLRFGVLRLARREHTTFLAIHHIVCDNWSMGVLVRELTVLYDAFFRGATSPLPELSLQYADYAHWQRQWLQGEELERHLAYWRRQLEGELPVLRLPVRSDAPPLPSSRGAQVDFSLPPELSAAVRELSMLSGTTVFMTLLSALNVLLHRHAPGDDLLVGTDVAHRARTEIEPLIGFFVNVLTLRTSLAGNPTFRELLARVRQVTLEAHAHQALPFERLVEELAPERTAGRASIFQVLFVLQNAPRTSLEIPGLQLTGIDLQRRTANFDLLLIMAETEGALEGFWNYRGDLFESSVITDLSLRFVRLLERILADPDARLSQLETSDEIENKHRAMKKKTRRDSKLEMFAKVKPQAVNISQESLVEKSFLNDQQMPLVLEPTATLDLVEWASGQQPFLEEKLLRHGAILFRGFEVDSVERFESFAEVLCGKLFDGYGDLPRGEVAGRVYTATPYPPEERILYHNESSQMHHWPLKQFFYCMVPAVEGGDTPIADCRKIYEELDPEIRELFARKNVMYVRNFVEGLDVSLDEFFGTTDRAAIEKACRDAQLEVSWRGDSELQTRSVAPGVARHPRTGELLFFNQIQAHHISFLKPEVRDSLVSMFGLERMPRNVYYGDGSPIEDEVMQEILELYDRHSVSFKWRPGDVLMVDNMLTAHSRNPYRGPRKIVVAMGEMQSAGEFLS